MYLLPNPDPLADVLTPTPLFPPTHERIIDDPIILKIADFDRFLIHNGWPWRSRERNVLLVPHDDIELMKQKISWLVENYGPCHFIGDKLTPETRWIGYVQARQGPFRPLCMIFKDEVAAIHYKMKWS